MRISPLESKKQAIKDLDALKAALGVFPLEADEAAQLAWCRERATLAEGYFKCGQELVAAGEFREAVRAYWQSMVTRRCERTARALGFFESEPVEEPGVLPVLNLNLAESAEDFFFEGLQYLSGIGVRQSDERAFEQFRVAVAQGNVAAQKSLGLMYEKGRGVRQDSAQAVHYYRLAAEQGEVIAQYNLGLMYANGRGVRQDSEQAVHYYRLAAEQGEAAAQNNLGWMYEKGRGVRQDSEQAVHYYRLAAAQGEATAQYNLGLMYEKGRGVRQDSEQAVYYYRLAVEQGDATAQYNLGCMYEKGRGVRQDSEQAVYYYRLAAEQGEAIAQNNLGWMYANGRGVRQDSAQAVHYYRLAAEQGYALAQNNLGWMYEKGRGVRQDLAQAVHYYRLAAEQGNADAKKGLKRLASKGDKCAQYHYEVVQGKSTLIKTHPNDFVAYLKEDNCLNATSKLAYCKALYELYERHNQLDAANLSYVCYTLATAIFSAQENWLAEKEGAILAEGARLFLQVAKSSKYYAESQYRLYEFYTHQAHVLDNPFFKEKEAHSRLAEACRAGQTEARFIVRNFLSTEEGIEEFLSSHVQPSLHTMVEQLRVDRESQLLAGGLWRVPGDKKEQFDLQRFYKTVKTILESEELPLYDQCKAILLASTPLLAKDSLSKTTRAWLTDLLERLKEGVYLLDVRESDVADANPISLAPS